MPHKLTLPSRDHFKNLFKRVSFFAGAVSLFVLGCFGLIALTCGTQAVGTLLHRHEGTAKEVFFLWANEIDLEVETRQNGEPDVSCGQIPTEKGVLCQFREVGRKDLQKAYCPSWPNLLRETVCDLQTRALSMGHSDLNE